MFWRRKQRYEAELDAELRDHLERQAADYMAQGISREEARRRALIEFGGAELAKEECRDVYALRLLWAAGRDLKHALRSLRKSPGFTAVAILVLGLGIAANLTAFTWVDLLFLRPLPVDAPQELVRIASISGTGNANTGQLTIFSKALDQLRAEPVFSGTCGFEDLEYPAELGGNLRPVRGLVMSGECFKTLGVRSQIGRPFAPADDSMPGERVALLTDSLWRGAFGGDPGVVGRQIRFGGVLFTVIGVVEPRFMGLNPGYTPGLVIPLNQWPLNFQPTPGVPFYFWVNIIARRAPGVSLDQVRARMKVLEPRFFEESAPLHLSAQQRKDYLDRRIVVNPASGAAEGQFLRSRFGEPLYAFWGLCAMTLAIACVSLATLLLARGLARRKEITVRLALGANRFSVFRLLAAENIVLVVAGAAAGAILAVWANNAIAARADEAFGISFVNVSRAPWVDTRAMMYLASLILLLILGLAAMPAWQVRRFSHHGGIAESGRGVVGASTWSQKILLAVQIAITLAMVSACGLLGTSIRHLYGLDLGFETRGVSMGLLRPDPATGTSGPAEPYRRELLTKVEGMSGVKGAALSGFAPFWNRVNREPVAVIEDADGAEVLAQPFAVTEHVFAVLGVPILAGETFREASEMSAIVSRSLADRLGGEELVGRHLRVGSTSQMQRLKVVGIAGNALLSLERPDETAPPMVYVNFWEHPERQAYSALLVKAQSPPDADSLRRLVQSLGHEYVADYRTLDRAKDDALIENSALAAVSSGFGVFALALAATGLFGLLSYYVAGRTPEIGIRMALGADSYDVRWMVIREILPVFTVGGVTGVGLALAAGTLMTDLVFGVGAHDPRLLGAALAVLLLTALLAAWIPAQRAAGVDPLRALRRD